MSITNDDNHYTMCAQDKKKKTPTHYEVIQVG